MSEFTPLREAVDTLAGRTPSPDFSELQRRATRRGRRRGAMIAAATVAMAAAATAAVIAGTTLSMTGLDDRPAAPVEQPTPTTQPAPGLNGWIALDVDRNQGEDEGDGDGEGDIYLVRPGEDAHRLEVAASDAANESCPVWSPDGTRLMFGRTSDSEDTEPSDPELVIVPVAQNGATGTPTVIELDDFEVLDGFDAHPCGTWAPDGRWVAFAGTGEVWVADTQTGKIRHLPDLRPSDLEWRPGTDELTIAGDVGKNRSAPTLSTPVTVYSVSSDELHQLGSVEAAHITWSPDGTTLVYTGGEADPQRLRLVDGNGANERVLVADIGENNHGIGPVWAPTSDRIAYQRLNGDGAELHEVVLVNATDGTERVIEPPETDGRVWYPFTVSWSPDGTTLLYTAWSVGDQGTEGAIAVSADTPSDVTVLTDALDPGDYYGHQWAPIQMWGRQPG